MLGRETCSAPWPASAPKVVAIIQRKIPHYRVKFFAEVQAHARRAGFEVTVYSGEPPDQRVRGDFRCRVLRAFFFRGRQDGPCWLSGLAAQVKGADIIVAPQELQCMNVPYLWANRAGLCRQWIWWGHGYNFQSSLRFGWLCGIKEAAKRFMTRRSDGLITYTAAGAEYWLRQGMPPARVVPYSNTLDVEGLREVGAGFDHEELSAVKARLGIEGKRVLLFSGRLLPEKEGAFLLRAFSILQRKRPDVALLLLGDGPEREALERLRDTLQLAHVHFLGECVEPARSGAYFRLADVLVIPGLVGLAIVHGFAFGLPLITTGHDCHGPEIEYLSPDNGLVTPRAEEAYARGIEAVLTSPVRLLAMQHAARAQGERMLVTDSAKRFVEGIRTLAAG